MSVIVQFDGGQTSAGTAPHTRSRTRTKYSARSYLRSLYSEGSSMSMLRGSFLIEGRCITSLGLLVFMSLPESASKIAWGSKSTSAHSATGLVAHSM